jgi:NTP pyrophosphatase (non-canonical NTP hydrolase)
MFRLVLLRSHKTTEFLSQYKVFIINIIKLNMKDFEIQIKEYLQERGWDDLRPADLAKSIMIEGAELLEIFQWDNLSAETIKTNPEKLSRVKKELADVMIYCFDMAVTLDIDVLTMLNEKLSQIKDKYPPHLFRNNTGQEPGTDEIYLNIKRQYRKAN